MRVTVCQLDNDPAVLETDWAALAGHVRRAASDLVVLPEMPFYGWLAAAQPLDEADRAARWGQAIAAHDAWLPRLAELSAPIVIGTRPALVEGRPVNEGFVWTAHREMPTGVMQAGHEKVYLPQEPGYWEESWYERGEGGFEALEVSLPDDALTVGFAICSELWFFGAARAYMEQGAEMIVTPRCTGLPSVEKWLNGGIAAAVVAGAYALSSNRAGMQEGMVFGGQGWIIDPDGEVIATTSTDQPFVTAEIDLGRARVAKSTYPRYIKS